MCSKGDLPAHVFNGVIVIHSKPHSHTCAHAHVTMCRCNRYDAQKKAHELLIQRRDKIVSEYAELERMGRFLHYFERYKGHGQSLEVS